MAAWHRRTGHTQPFHEGARGSHSIGHPRCGRASARSIVTNADLAKHCRYDRRMDHRAHAASVSAASRPEDELTSNLGIAAAHQALVRAGIDPVDIDLVICATATPDRTFPATAVRIQAGLGVTKGAAFDFRPSARASSTR